MVTVDVTLEDNHFAWAKREVELFLVQEVRRAGHAIARMARQLIIAWDAIITGDLYRSVRTNFSDAGTAVNVEATMPYARHVHDGTKYMRPRPFLTTAVQRYQPELNQRMADGLFK